VFVKEKSLNLGQKRKEDEGRRKTEPAGENDGSYHRPVSPSRIGGIEKYKTKNSKVRRGWRGLTSREKHSYERED